MDETCAKYGLEITVYQLGEDVETKKLGRTKNRNKKRLV